MRKYLKESVTSSLSRGHVRTGFTAPNVLSLSPVLGPRPSCVCLLHTRGQGRRRRCGRLQARGQLAPLHAQPGCWPGRWPGRSRGLRGRLGQPRRAPASGRSAGTRKAAALVFARVRPLAFFLLGRWRHTLEYSNLSLDCGV